MAANNTNNMTNVNFADMTENDRADFVDGWEAAGGVMNDIESATPWCAPWTYQREANFAGANPREWGAEWWAQNRAEIEALAAETE